MKALELAMGLVRVVGLVKAKISVQTSALALARGLELVRAKMLAQMSALASTQVRTWAHYSVADRRLSTIGHRAMNLPL